MNLLAEFNDLNSTNYQNVHVCGIFILISSALLNQFLGLSVLDDLVVTYPSDEQMTIKLSGGTVWT